MKDPDRTRHKSYKASLIYTKSYRQLRNYVSELLMKHTLTNIEWAIIGYLYENKKGSSLNELSELLGVEPPFITTTIDKLQKREFVEKLASQLDQRVKIVQLSKKGKQKVLDVEKILSKEMEKILVGVSSEELLIHLKVLETIIRNT